MKRYPKQTVLISLIALALVMAAGGAAFVHAATVQYTYDTMNRLIRAEYADGSLIEYTYDTMSNRTQMRRQSPQLQRHYLLWTAWLWTPDASEFDVACDNMGLDVVYAGWHTGDDGA